MRVSRAGAGSRTGTRADTGGKAHAAHECRLKRRHARGRRCIGYRCIGCRCIGCRWIRRTARECRRTGPRLTSGRLPGGAAGACSGATRLRGPTPGAPQGRFGRNGRNTGTRGRTGTRRRPEPLVRGAPGPPAPVADVRPNARRVRTPASPRACPPRTRHTSSPGPASWDADRKVDCAPPGSKRSTGLQGPQVSQPLEPAEGTPRPRRHTMRTSAPCGRGQPLPAAAALSSPPRSSRTPLPRREAAGRLHARTPYERSPAGDATR